MANRSRKSISSKTTNDLIKAMNSHCYVGTTKSVIADLESPEWPITPTDWSYFVPPFVKDLWGRLPLEARAAVRATAAWNSDLS